MRKPILILICLMTTLSLWSQSERKITKGTQPLQNVELEVMPYQDNAQLLEDELARREPGIAPRFAQKINTQISPATHGTWEEVEPKLAVWRLQIYSAKAKSINLGFTKYEMPAGGQLLLYNPNLSQILGPFTPADNESHQQLWTPILEGDELVIEVRVPQAEKENLQLELSYVNHDFLGFSQLASGTCNLDVACGADDDWEIVDQYRDIIRSVANIGVQGDIYCSGFLINNTRNDRTPYFITADHCGFNSSNAASLVAYWGFENSTCRTPNTGPNGSVGDGSLETYNTGAYFRAGHSPSDITLMELDDPVPLDAVPFMAGWSREDIAPADTMICIHHPNNDEKRISFEFDPSYFGTWGNGEDYVPNGNHLIVADWDVGTTEGGSSGSPLFNSRKEVVGQLHGGNAACGNDLYDSFGRFYAAWEGGGTPDTRLKDWLDPDNLGVMTWPGIAVYSEISTLTLQQEVCLPGEVTYTLKVGSGFTNDVTLSVPNLLPEANASFSVNPVPPGGTTVLTINEPQLLPLGLQTIRVSGYDGNDTKSLDLSLTIFDQTPAMLYPIWPEDGTTIAAPQLMYRWEMPTSGNTYQIEIATDDQFNNIIESATVQDQDQYLGQLLESMTTYYWRVKATNVCGEGDWSPVSTFTTSLLICNLGSTSATTPVNISSSGTPTIVSTLQVNESLTIAGINIRNLAITHSWIGDLSAELESPQGTVVKLFSEPSYGGCPNDDLLLHFEQAATNTYFDLFNTCEETSPAISGTFQPEESLLAFYGEDAQGTWTLRIRDSQDQDGGRLEGWTIDFCGTLPAVVGVFPEFETVETCPEALVSIRVQAGTAYQDDVTLSLSGAPPGAAVEITPNPISPGGVATITIDAWEETGTFDLTVVGENVYEGASNNFSVVVLEEPDEFSTIQPIDSAIDLPPNVTFSWTSSEYAHAYELTVRAASATGAVLLQETVTTTSFDAVLSGGQAYFWQVKAINLCGEEVENGGTFRTAGSLNNTVLPANLTMCQEAQSFTRLSIATGFLTPSVVTYSIDPLADFEILFDADPENVAGGDELDVTLKPSAAVAPGIYTITFLTSDGIHQSETSVEAFVESKPLTAGLSQPVNGASINTTLPVFSWEEVPEILFYLFEIATDETFDQIVTSGSAIETNYTLTSPLEEGTTYYWRVIAYNDCGLTESAISSFSTLLTGLSDLTQMELMVFPNPADDIIYLQLGEDYNRAGKIQLYSADGRLLVDEPWDTGQKGHEIQVQSYAEGIYFLRLFDGTASRSQRIFIQH